MTLSNLAKYVMTRSIARPLCNSRATCWDTDRQVATVAMGTTQLVLSQFKNFLW